MVRVRVIDPILGPTIRGDINITDEFSSQTGGKDSPPESDKMSSPAVCAPTPDMVLLTVQPSDTEFPTLGKTGSEADHNFFPWLI